jgi:hypothetical protein
VLSLGGLSDGRAVAGTVLTTSLSDPNGAAGSVLYTFTDTTTRQILASGAGDSYRIGRNLAGDTIGVTAAYVDAQGFSDQAPASATVAPALAPAAAGDKLVLTLSEDAWKGDAQFTVSVDGVQLGGPQTVTADHAGGQVQAFTFNGQFGSAAPTVAVDFLNDAWGGSADTDRNLHVASLTLNGVTRAVNASQGLSGPAVYGGQAATASAAASAGVLVLHLSEDAWDGDAQFTVSVDGAQIGDAQSVTASHSAGQVQNFAFDGLFGTGPHMVAVDFLNDAWGGSAAADRNLYVDAITLGGGTSSLNAVQGVQGAAAYAIQAPSGAVSAPARDGTLVLHLSEDAWSGDAQFTVSVDGTQVGGVQSVTALHGAGQSQDLALSGSFAAGAHAVAITFLNDAWGGDASSDRNLYVDGITLGGTTTAFDAGQYCDGTATYDVTAASASDTTAGAVALTAGAGTTLILDDLSAAAGTPVTFGGSGATLQLTAAERFMGTLASFGTGDRIDLRSIGPGGSTTLDYAGDATSGTLSVTDGTHTAQLAMLGRYGSGSFALAPDGHGGTAVAFVGS